MSNLSARRITAEEEFFALEQSWDNLHTRMRGPVFLTFAWLRNWWKIYKEDKDALNILTIWDEKKLVGILPTFLESFSFLGMTAFVCLRFLGVYETYGEYMPLVDPDYALALAPLMAAFCVGELRSRRCDLVSFFRYPARSPFMEDVVREMGKHDIAVKHEEKSVSRIVMDLPADWESYLKSLSAGERRILGRRTRALMKHGVEVERFGYCLNGDAEFNEFVRLHTVAWTERGILGYFASSKKFEEFQRRITPELGNKYMARLYFLKKDGERIAAVQAFFVNGQCCFYLSGLNRHHELAHYSPGKVLLSLVIKDAIEEGYAVFDFQGGKEEYKLRLGGKEAAFSKTLLWQNGFGTVRTAVFLFFRGSRRFVVEYIWEERVQKTARRLFRSKHFAKSLI